MRVAAIFFLAGAMVGCAARVAKDHVDQGRMFKPNSCNQVIPAKPDGYLHFVCQDMHYHKWEVLIRREGK